MNRQEVFEKFFLAEHLHKTVDEIEEITLTEFYLWREYFERKRNKR